MKPLMPRAVAVWLIENTSLTFKQIADFCMIHLLEVESIANEETHKSLQPMNPISSGELSEEDIKACELDPTKSLAYVESKEYNKYTKVVKKDSTKQSKFKKKAKPESILWIINHYPDINDYQISKLLRTTTNTIKSIRSKGYWNYKNLSPKNPVSLGLCEEQALSKLIESSAKKLQDQA